VIPFADLVCEFSFVENSIVLVSHTKNFLMLGQQIRVDPPDGGSSPTVNSEFA
jgi:hypothetical protein